MTNSDEPSEVARVGDRWIGSADDGSGATARGTGTPRRARSAMNRAASTSGAAGVSATSARVHRGVKDRTAACRLAGQTAMSRQNRSMGSSSIRRRPGLP